MCPPRCSVPETAWRHVDAFLQKGQPPTVVLDKTRELLQSGSLVCSTIAHTNRHVNLFTLFLALDIFVESVEVLHSGIMLPSQSS
jgi:hypothetical protein